MLIVYPFSVVDQDLALQNARWMNELGGCKGHEVFFLYDKRCHPQTVTAIYSELLKAFDQVHRFECPALIDGWPEGANYFFRVATAKLQNKPDTSYFMWMEPDAIPLGEGWLDEIEKIYLDAGKPFMGDRVEVEDIPLHMSGVGIYPLPLHAYAGEAYRASETAWDMAGKDQIVPQAHFTRLIEHAWKHPTFNDPHELTTQIRPEAVLFHGSKDGSLIRLLRAKLFPAAPVLAEPSVGNDTEVKQRETRGGEAKGESPERESARATTVPNGDSRGGREQTILGSGGERDSWQACSTTGIPGRDDPSPPTCDIFIRTYPGDYQWLEYCLKAVEKFASGFRKVWVISTEHNPFGGPSWLEWKQMNDESEDGYLAQQITKLYADVITDYQAEFILHIDSDVILTRPTRPENFLAGRQVIWPYTSYTEIQTPWQPITEKFMGRKVSHEFMRRFPLMVPRWLYPRLREFCYQQHGMPVADYIRLQPARAFSEFNALGAYAYQCHHNDFIWLNTLEQPLEDSYARQFHSWGGITEEVKAELERILRGTKESSPTIQSGEKADPTVLEGGPGANFVSSQIKVLPNGVWVLRGDQISQWIEEEGRLDHDQNFLPKILAHINPGDNVVDVGAFVGDHTIAYARAVGKSGRVYAFEPNPMALECLSHNLFADSQENNRVIIHAVALGEEAGSVPLSGNNGNWGGAYVGEHMKIGQVACRKLDDYNLSPDLIKIDAEGYELKVLRGAERTIEAHRPKLVIEMNVEALRRQGTSYEDILFWLRDHQYSWVVMQENCTLNSPMYDIFCSYNQISPEVPLTSDKGEGGLTRCASSPPPVTSPPLTPYGEMIAAVLLLKKFADVDSNHRMRVMQHLSKNGLTPRWPKRKKKRK